ncbi:Retrovirus-related Pol polyprotein from transposon 297 [Vitis vinifera]|uniref:RNA-directed DNA polymerase n=1 Tax=Vitis vinifera TaxID=29760 RepID=A0A438FSM4_VITVI|nr:Retrovirus-related Pol polyprotein from transposon 297 [Vitis vinifera]
MADFSLPSPPCIPDLLMAKDFKASVLHVSKLSIALPWIPNNCPQSQIALYKDPRCPTISVMIGGKVVEKALLDLGATVNLLPYSVYKQLGLGELKPTSITLSLADRSVKIPRGIIEDVLVQKKEEGPKEVCIIDTLVEEHYDQNMQDKLNESLGDLEEGLSEPSDVGATLQGAEASRYYYPISDRPWVSPTQVVPKKSGITVVQNEKGEEIATRLTSGGRVCIDYRKLNAMIRKDHFPLPFIDQVLERVSGHPFYCFLDGYSGYFQIEIDVEDQEKTTFTCPFGTYTYRRMLFGLCNAPVTFQRCMLTIFNDMVERIMEVFMDDISIYGGIFLGHIISKKGIEVDKAKVELIVKLPSPTTVKGVRQFLGHASDFAIGVVLDQREDGKPYVIYYASKTLNEAQRNYTTTEKELLAVVFALDKFRAYLVGSFIIVFTDHSALKYLLTKQDAKARLIRWILLLQEFDLQIGDKKGVESVEKTPWYAHIANYLVTGEVPSEWKAQYRKHFFAKIHAYYWEEPFLFKVVLKFLKENIFSRFGVPKAIISDGGGDYEQKDWSIKLHDSLWAYRTTYKTILGMSPSRLVYDKACYLPVEVEHKAWWVIKRLKMDLIRARAKRCLDLNEMEKLRNDTYIQFQSCKTEDEEVA